MKKYAPHSVMRPSCGIVTMHILMEVECSRNCVGLHLSRNTVWLALISIESDRGRGFDRSSIDKIIAAGILDHI